MEGKEGDKIKAQIKAITENLADERGEKLVRGLVKVDIETVLKQLLHLQNVVLPAIEGRGGKKNEQYEFYKAVADSLLWSVMLHERAAFWKLEFDRQRQVVEYFRANSIRLERELMKYQFAEDALITDQDFEKLKEEIGKRLAQIKRGEDDLRG